MLHKLPHVGRKVTPPSPQPTFMNKDQKTEYLANLRNNRPTRPTPTGSRPAPFKSRTSTDQHGLARTESAMSLRGGDEESHADFEVEQDFQTSHRSPTHRHSMMSERSMPSLRSNKGRPLVQPPSAGTPSVRGRKVSPTATIETNARESGSMYKESGTRWLERQEAHALRQALQVMDAESEEKLHQAALNEAADLVWQHRNPGAIEKEQIAGYRNPDLAKQLKSHLVHGAHERSQSDGYIALGKGRRDGEPLRTVSEGSNNSEHMEEPKDPTMDKSKSKKKRLSDAMQQLRIASGQAIASVDTSKLRNFSGGRRRMSGQRDVSNKSATFPNPDDKIFEEPEEVPAKSQDVKLPQEETAALQPSSTNAVPFATRPLPQKADTMPTLSKARPNPFDRRRRQAEQPKAAPYTSDAATPPPMIIEPETIPMKEGKEIRSDDIRAATSMKRSDRSPKLPTPTAVSDKAGRPIVSFDRNWKAPAEIRAEERGLQAGARPVVPTVAVSAPAVPTINLPASGPSIPTINLPDEDEDPYDPPQNIPHGSVPSVPTFSFDGPDDDQTPRIIATQPKNAAPRPLPQHTQSAPHKPSTSTSVSTPTSKLPWLNRNGPTATCAACALPISGRIVTASANDEAPQSQTQTARFHPTCFTCFHCSTALECVAFYPEPPSSRSTRLSAAAAESNLPLTTALNDNDPLRFYCHLDFHELFSPRCRTCKTPIEGAVILAAGGEYHAGHFFCAECGDPFGETDPFVEKGGYAYCVPCHRRTTGSRCKGCKGVILDEESIQAMGGNWHGGCFVCDECRGGFGEEGRFYVREVQMEATAKERRRGVDVKVEERPVCGGCEARRLKA